MADAVVVGAGHNGLVAANMLADAGWDVEVLEAQPEPGGAVRSDRGVHPDFVSDLCSAFYPLGVASPVMRAMELERHGLRWRHAPAVLAHPLPDGRSAVLERDRDATAGGLDALGGGDGEAWLRLCRIWDEMGRTCCAPCSPRSPRSGRRCRWRCRRGARAGSASCAPCWRPSARSGSRSSPDRAARCCSPDRRCTPTCSPRRRPGRSSAGSWR
ncbi:phytoene desaturase family protein [Actinomadura madurae]|uniref:phytoene desaturase family protein n=1 Tax=Actinomadura madurae TaxID=1993 RepID=UPI0020D22076|nr:FAD-dependent oxidoreductase [Actinomadura madurae]MCQ0013334.1 NAD(P)-binding protein [Actinomadura madurae]